MLLAEDLIEGRAIEAGLRELGLSADPERVLSLIVIALPAFVVMAWSLLTLGNMWLAQVILERAGHNLRPTPNLLDIEYPPFLLALFLAALILSLIPGSAAQLGGAIMIALLVPYFLLGLAVIHAISRAWDGPDRTSGRFLCFADFYRMADRTGLPDRTRGTLGCLARPVRTI